jgi:hypothetical protein
MSAQAATNVINFNSDPKPSGLYALHGTVVDVNGADASWRPNGGASGAAGDGYLAVTDASGNSHSVLVFKDLEAGLIVKAFTFECDLRIGGGRGGTTEPADGFSINYASADDPIVVASDADEDPGGLFAGTINEPAPSGLAEEGTQTGLAIGFDSWASGPVSASICDVVGMSIRVDGEVVAQLPVPISPGNVYYPSAPHPGQQGTNYVYDAPDPNCAGGGGVISPTTNVSTNDPLYLNSLQTGALNSTDDLDGDGVPGEQSDFDAPQPQYGDPNYDKWIKNLAWARFKIELTEDGYVKIFWKGVEITPPGGIATTFSPIPGRIVFGGRTGGSWLVHQVDNITLVTIPADKIVISKVLGTPTGFALVIIDSGQSVLNPSSVQLKLNGNPVTVSSVTKAASTGTSTLRFSGPPLAAGSTNTVDITASDGIGNTVTSTKKFVVPGYYSVPPAFAVSGVDTSKPGFKLKVHQVDLAQVLPTSVARAEHQLHGDIGPNVATIAPGPDGYVVEPAVINYEQGDAGGTPQPAGNFTNEVLIPGIPGAGGILERNQDNVAMEILTYIQFPAAGAYRITFNSDDGFRTYVGNQVVDVLASPIFSEADVSRGASDTAQWIYVAQAGAYPFRTVWFEGGGGASLEWSAESDLGVRALINDSSVTGALKAYREATGSKPAAVTYAYPDRSSGNPYFPTEPITVEWTDGTTQVSTGSIQLWVNDASVTVAPTKTGAVTKLQYNPPAGGWPSGSNNKVTLVWSDNGTPAVVTTNTWSFSVQPWVSLPPSAALAASAVDTTKTGFKVRTYKADVQNDINNTIAGALGMLSGANGPNKLDTSVFGPDGYYVESGVINYEHGALPANSPYDATSITPQRSGNFTDQIPPDVPVADALFPGQPITDATYSTLVYSNKWGDDMAMDVLTVLDLQQGWYWTGVNSDDGFRVSFAANPLDVTAVVAAIADYGKGASDINGLFYVQQSGLYPCRLIWEQGGGGASCEWYMQNTVNYQRTLVNETAVTGFVKAYQYPVAAPPAAYVKSITPTDPGAGIRPGVGLGKKVEAVIVDGATPIDANSIVVKLNGTAVSPITKNKSGNETTVTYNQALPANSKVTVELSWTDSAPRSSSWSFNTGILPGSTFVIEAEDFNSGGGQTQAAASTMPYFGGSYSNLSATLGVDYKEGDGNDSRPYRPTLVPNANMDAGPGDFDRGGWDLKVNYKIGWIDNGDWFDYTRTFPAGSYNAYVAVSHTDAPTSATRIGGTLQLVTGGVTTTNQTLTQLGTFDGPATGGWGLNRLIPLTDASGNAVSLSLSGAQTLRYTASNGDYDFLAFVPATSPPQLRFDPPIISGNQVTISWVGTATLQEASNLTGSANDWSNVSPPPSGTTFTATVSATGQKFYRLKQ